MSRQTIDCPHIIGCDVGKHEIVVYDNHKRSLRRVANCPDRLAQFAAKLAADCLVICEATGHYEAALLAALHAAGRPAHRADARKVKAFVRSFGTLAKTDAIDAEALARYGEERYDRLSRWQPSAENLVKLQALVRYRFRLVKHRTAEKNRLKAPKAALIAHHIKTAIAALDTQIAALEAEIKELVEADQEIAQRLQVAHSITGFGPVNAIGILALMPELGTLTRRQAASLAGLAPHPNSSGIRDGYRRTRGGRSEIKYLLFTAALTASRHHPELKAFRLRLLAKGKKPIVVIVAIMRKLIVMLNAKLRDARLAQADAADRVASAAQ